MSLDNIQLSPKVIAELYKETLVVLNALQTSQNNDMGAEGTKPRKILLLTATAATKDENAFLDKLLQACKLGREEVNQISIAEHKVAYGDLTHVFGASIVLMFGVNPAQIGLPLEFPRYQVQGHHNRTYLYCDAPGELKEDLAAKKILWDCLRKIFGI
jgi:hypothetical protein